MGTPPRKATISKRKSKIHILRLALRQVGDVEAAIVELREAVRIAPDNAEIHSELAQALDERSHLEDAIIEYRTAMSLGLDSGAIHMALALALLEVGNEEDGLVEMRRAVELEPDTWEYRNNLAHLLAINGLRAEAKREFGIASTLERENE